ncbi:hypothetical protein ACQKLP_23915 [Chitinophaga sp. NPDC101104]|uniref:hypothetical protein n=1 Tax=Chitinophaga sp. NPDC101104 TaxID=3390561 RepID=UPI003D020CBD
MATFFIDYQHMVLAAYERKKKDNALPYGLKYLTPAKIKEDCELRCTQSVSKLDEKTIRQFCGDLNEAKTILTVVQRCETDKFRPLVNFIKGKSEKPDEKHVELLAWLIDFPGRPFTPGKDYSAVNVKAPATNEPEPVLDKQIVEAHFMTTSLSKELIPPASKPEIPEIPMPLEGRVNAENSPIVKENTKSKSAKRLAIAAILSLAMGTAATWWWKDTNQPLDLNGGCMYWKEDHYEPIACNEKIENARVIALDSVKLKNFRKITRPDTITIQSLGKVWYSKIDGKIEYFTADGEHPVNFERKLKLLSTYMLNKYIISNAASK